MQLDINNEKYAENAKTLAGKNQKFINYWCSTDTVTQKNKINDELLHEKVQITYDDEILFEGEIVDIQIHTVEDTYYSKTLGGNAMLGLPENYSLNDFLYEINDSFESKEPYYQEHEIASILIRIDRVLAGKRRGRQDFRGTFHL